MILKKGNKYFLKELSVFLIIIIFLLFLSEAYMMTVSKQEMERVLRLPGIASRDQNRVEVDSSYIGALEKSKLTIAIKKETNFLVLQGRQVI